MSLSSPPTASEGILFYVEDGGILKVSVPVVKITIVRWKVKILILITYIDSKSAQRLLATYSSSTDFKFSALHSAIIFSRSWMDFSNAAIRASLN